jgi:dienelactone hydrolase
MRGSSKRRAVAAVAVAVATVVVAGVGARPAGAMPGAGASGADARGGPITGTAGLGGEWGELRHQFDYVREPVRVLVHSVSRRGGAVVRDITYRVAGQEAVDAYLVTPARAGRYPGVLFLHWLDEAPSANRTEFLAEAVGLAERRGVVALLPQLEFPFAFGPVGDGRDRDSVVKQVVQLRRGLDLLDARPDVDRSRVAVVGHDYGAMYGVLLAAVDRDRVRANVVMAADATFGNWFSVFFLGLEGEADSSYRALLVSLDPVAYLPHAPRGGVLLQYATNDFFIPHSVAERVAAATAEPKTVREYDADHSLDVPQARADRDAYLERVLHL